MEAAERSVRRRGRFVAALSGGSTPREMHRLLAREPYLSGIPWEHTHLFWVDERCVPWSHVASNYGAARRDFLDRLPLRPGQIHPMPSGSLPDEGASQYEVELRTFFQTRPGECPVFDLILLGMGPDGHTASLFPDHPALSETERPVLAVKGGDPDVSRLTLTYPLINQARKLVFLVSGRSKAGAVKAVLQEKDPRLPAQRVRPAPGGLVWLLDKEAASLLNET
jgi:6-phosphogluconolactonase